VIVVPANHEDLQSEQYNSPIFGPTERRDMVEANQSLSHAEWLYTPAIAVIADHIAVIGR
jgi:hypothetical protein